MNVQAQSAIARMQPLADYYRARYERARCHMDKRHWSAKLSEIEYCIQIVEEEFAETPMVRTA